MFFENHFISYSCILFIKYYALRSLCIKLLCFSKNWFFQDFNRSNLFLDQSKLRLKFMLGSVCFDQSKLQLKILGLVLCVSIDRTYFSINQKSYREFFLNLCFPRIKSLLNFFKKVLLSLFDRSRVQIKFLSFSSKIFARFFSSKAGKTFLPFLLHLFSCFMHFGENFEPMDFWDFWWFKLFFSKLINGFLL